MRLISSDNTVQNISRQCEEETNMTAANMTTDGPLSAKESGWSVYRQYCKQRKLIKCDVFLKKKVSLYDWPLKIFDISEFWYAAREAGGNKLELCAR